MRRWEALHVRFSGEPAGFLRLADALAQAGRGAETADLLGQARDFFPSNKEVAAAAEGVGR